MSQNQYYSQESQFIDIYFILISRINSPFFLQIPSGSFVSCLGIVVNQLDKYNSECTVAHRQRLVWKLSNRTLRHLRPTDKLRATLPTIKESSNLQLMRYVLKVNFFKKVIFWTDFNHIWIFPPKWRVIFAEIDVSACQIWATRSCSYHETGTKKWHAFYSILCVIVS